MPGELEVAAQKPVGLDGARPRHADVPQLHRRVAGIKQDAQGLLGRWGAVGRGGAAKVGASGSTIGASCTARLACMAEPPCEGQPDCACTERSRRSAACNHALAASLQAQQQQNGWHNVASGEMREGGGTFM